MAERWRTIIIGISGAIAVAFGAYGAHGLEGKAAGWATTGAHYQLIHLVAAMALIAMPVQARWPIRLFLIGGWIFAGTLYAMALGAPHWLGAITPIGGGMLIAGWVSIAVSAARD